MLARKQPFIQRVRNSSLVERQGIDDNRASSILPKRWTPPQGGVVGEHSMGDEAVLRGMVERMEKQM
jgi:hypothetical protein